uniref:Si:dkey-33i11.9 n=2 Tax=Cynoglossus semilaevis TaxID=244447 RepID=A0A3P8VWI3_CYNSE
SQQYPGQAVVITGQPTVFATQGALARPVNDYLGYSIFTMLCCCLPIGIAALIHSIFTRDAIRNGDQTTAEKSSRMARNLNHTALGIGLAVFIASIIFIVVTLATA